MQFATWKEAAENLKYALTEHNYPKRQILLEISELVQRDVGSGIQRVVRSILNESLENPPRGFRVEPVYATPNRGYRYARNYARRLGSNIPDNANNDPIEYAPGDVFLGLDLQPQVVQAQRAFYQTLRNHGVKVRFVIYDLLCVLMPEHFLPGSGEGFAQWLDVVMESDGAICISKAVADDARAWFDTHGAVRQRPFEIDWFHLGADTRHHAPLAGLSEEGETTLQKITLKRSFLTVSTIEPRKGHAQVLAAFERLWSDGIETNLVIVGREGWMVDELCDKIRSHSELNQRLFWLDGVNDEYLEKVYSASTCLIAASYGEGFGLPLIEAAQHGLPILARDIPIFREVAGEHASYFQAQTPADLAIAIENWLILHKEEQHPGSKSMKYLTWAESAELLLGKIINTKIPQ
jgi:glycosyltransferase involved in cell wall biosynthesis